MKKTRFTETQIVKAIQEHESGKDAKELCRELCITTAPFISGGNDMVDCRLVSLKGLRNWKKKIPDLNVYMSI